MGKIIELSHDDVQNELAYALICETMEGAYWNSGRRRRMFSKAFTRSEQQRISNIKAKALDILPTAKATCTAYHGVNNITVEFEDGFVLYHARWNQFVRGTLHHDEKNINK